MPRFFCFVFLALALMAAVASGLPAMARGRSSRPRPRPPARAPVRRPTVSPQLTADEKAVSTASADLEKATTALEEASMKLLADIEKTPEVIAAKKAVAEAEVSGEAARAAVIGKLDDNAVYKSAENAEAAGRAELDKLRHSDAQQEAISAKATDVLNLGNVTSKIEQDALSVDGTYTDAQAKLVAANAALADLRKKFRESLKTDPRLTKVLKARDDARAKMTAAEARLAAVRG